MEDEMEWDPQGAEVPPAAIIGWIVAMLLIIAGAAGIIISVVVNGSP